VTESVAPEQGSWFEHALEWERVPDVGDRPARCMITRLADPGETALPQVFYRRIDDLGEERASSIDADLFGDIVRRWLTPEESEEAAGQALFR
jgi:hypothetical protein